MSQERIARVVNRVVSAEELRQALEREIPQDERDEVKALVRWFTARYPSPEERLAYVRQAYARWRKNLIAP